MAAVFIGAALFAGCSREKPKETATQPEPAAPIAAAPVAEAPIGTASQPATVTPAPPPAQKRAVATAPAGKSSRRAPTIAQPGAPGPAPSVAPSSSREAALPQQRTPAWQELTLNQGTVLPLVLTTGVSSESALLETSVSARLRQPIVVDGKIALPEGTVFVGTVTDVERSGRVEGRAHVAFVFDRAQLKDTTLPVRTQAVRYEAEATKSEDAAKIGGGAVGGAIIGGILGGAKGAAKGAAVGGAAGTGVVVMTRGKEVTLAPGTEFIATLTAPLTVTIPRN